MKKSTKLFLFITLCLMGTLCLASCNKKDGTIVTIIQYTTATPLDQAREGIIEALKEGGFEDGKNITIQVLNCEKNQSTLKQMVEKALGESDLIFAIATPVAQALKSEVDKQGSTVPILFTAVTDPVDAGILEDATHPGGNISGTNDMNPVAQQTAFIKDLNPNAKKIGVLYTSSEDNSILQLNLVKTKAQEIGIEVEAKAVTGVNDLMTAIDALIAAGVDAIYLPTDNNVSENAKAVIDKINLNSIPTICGESTFVEVGGTITLGVSYPSLGKITGEMGVKILKNEVKVGDIPVGCDTNLSLMINVTVAEASGITISQALKDRADTIK